MSMEDLPLSAGFMPCVSDPKRCRHRFAILTCPGEMLDTAGNTQFAVSYNLKFEKFAFYILGVVEEIVEVAAHRFGAGVFQRRNEIIQDDVVWIEATERL